MKNEPSKATKRRLIFEQLEPRVLFSADPLLASLDGHVLQADAKEHTVLSTDLAPAINTPSADVGAEIRRERPAATHVASIRDLPDRGQTQKPEAGISRDPRPAYRLS